MKKRTRRSNGWIEAERATAYAAKKANKPYTIVKVSFLVLLSFLSTYFNSPKLSSLLRSDCRMARPT